VGTIDPSHITGERWAMSVKYPTQMIMRHWHVYSKSSIVSSTKKQTNKFYIKHSKPIIYFHLLVIERAKAIINFKFI
jgi:hypothetical protein